MLIEAAQVLEDEYIYEDTGLELATYLRTHSTEYDSYESTEAFAEAVTADLFEIANDKHLSIFIKPDEPQNPGSNGPDKKEPTVSYCRSAAVEYRMLSDRVGYIQFPWFRASAGHLERFDEAMIALADSDGLILDLRGNCGGTGMEVRHLSTYFFSEPTHLVNTEGRREEVSERWTLERVPGPRYVDKPLYVLADGDTFSAAESFIFGLQVLDRITLVGERTGGGGHYGGMARLSPELVIFVPVGRTYDPRTNESWEAEGIHPDIEASSEDALDVALSSLQAELEPDH